MTTYHEGDRVRALRSVQGMREGEVYRVIRVEVWNTAWGGFTTLDLDRDGTTIRVGNPHLVIRPI